MTRLPDLFRRFPSDGFALLSAATRSSPPRSASRTVSIPNVLPGEVFTEEVLEFLRRTAQSPFGHVRGSLDPGMTQVRVLLGHFD